MLGLGKVRVRDRAVGHCNNLLTITPTLNHNPSNWKMACCEPSQKITKVPGYGGCTWAAFDGNWSGKGGQCPSETYGNDFICYYMYYMHSINLPSITCMYVCIGLYRENAIAIQNESGDSNGGNV